MNFKPENPSQVLGVVARQLLIKRKHGGKVAALTKDAPAAHKTSKNFSTAYKAKISWNAATPHPTLPGLKAEYQKLFNQVAHILQQNLHPFAILDSSADGKLHSVRFLVVPDKNPIMEFNFKFEPDRGSVEYVLFALHEKYQGKGIDDLVNLASVRLLESFGGSTITIGESWDAEHDFLP